MHNNIYHHNDVMSAIVGDLHTFTHTESKFPQFTLRQHETLSCFHELYTTAQHGLKVLLHLRYLGYLVVNPQGIVMGSKLQTFDDAVRLADELDSDYARWLVLHTFKGLPKSRFVSEVKQDRLQARLVYTALKGRPLDDGFFPLVKREGVGSIDICRGADRYSSLFYINSFNSVQMVYTGAELLIYDAAYRLYNSHELAVQTEWESMRDTKEEWLDAMTDGSTQFWRQKEFFSQKGVSYLIGANYPGLVLDSSLRGDLRLKYEIRKV